MDLFIHRDGQEFGPYSVDEVNDLLATGDLLPDDLVWYEGEEDWLPLSEFAEQPYDETASETDASESGQYDFQEQSEEQSHHEEQSEESEQPHLIHETHDHEHAAGPDEHAEVARANGHASELTSAKENGHRTVAAVAHQAHTPPPTALVPGPLVAPPPLAVTPTLRDAQPPWVPARRDTSGLLPVASIRGRGSRSASLGATASASASTYTGPVISEKEALQFAKKFTSRAIVENPEHAAGARKVIVGGLLLVVGIGVSVILYQATHNHGGGGAYLLGWAAIAFGAFLFIRGLAQIFSE